MNSPTIWILFPALLGLILYLIRRWFRLTVSIGFGGSVFWALLAWFLPIGEPIRLGSWSIQVNDSFQILGRRLVLGSQDHILVWMVFTMSAFWFAAVYLAEAGRNTVPLGLMMVAFMLAAIAVEPLLYAALLLELAVLVSIPIFIQPGFSGITVDRQLIGLGLRLLTLQTLGMAFLLISGWALSGVEAMPDQEAVLRVSTLMAVGFALILGVFPFHTWIPGLVEKSHPYAGTFVLVFLPWIGLLVGLRFLDRYVWMGQVQAILTYMRVVGCLMVFIGGASAAFESHLGRMLGYAVLVETGFGLLSAGFAQSQVLIFSSLLPRFLSFGILSLTINVIRTRVDGLSVMNLYGIGLRYPLISAALIIALLSLVGLPTLAFFPIRLALWDVIAGESIWIALISLIGPVGLLVATVRVTLWMVGETDLSQETSRTGWQIIFFSSAAIFLLIFVGIFPHWFSTIFSQGMQSFTNLAP